MSTQTQTPAKTAYPTWAKMPKSYNFKKTPPLKPYEKYSTLRTDAVWEKNKLQNYFRLFYKIPYYNKSTKKYTLVTPAEYSTHIYHFPAIFNTAVDYMGLTKTGRTNSFNFVKGAHKAEKTTKMGNYSKQDYYELCAYRFDRWDDCDMRFSGEDKIQMAERHEEYPCFDMFYEAQHACNDQLFDFMMELSVSRREKGVRIRETFNRELFSKPTIWDAKDDNDRIKMTY